MTADASVEKQIDENLDGLVEQLQTEAANKTELAISSNPYDYLKNSAAYSNIVNLGTDARL
ncbi:hypothetical protein [Paenibacillus sp. NPDC058177]|uniref:hypothetical protein n=1 Tax=Paenibacillus sp. NPDC058177 TaxID=3346369 RepID=UPI0036DD4461